MARSKASARDALMKVQRQREELAAEEARLREAQLPSLGKVMLDCGAEAFEPSQLRRLDGVCPEARARRDPEADFAGIKIAPAAARGARCRRAADCGPSAKRPGRLPAGALFKRDEPFNPRRCRERCRQWCRGPW